MTANDALAALTRPETAAAGAKHQPGEPGERGRLRIARSVLAAIAAQATDEVADTVRAPRRRGWGTRGTSAGVSGPDSQLRLRVRVALRYPAPIREVTERIGQQVTDELQRLAGCGVATVEVTVARLVPAKAAARVE